MALWRASAWPRAGRLTAGRPSRRSLIRPGAAPLFNGGATGFVLEAPLLGGRAGLCRPARDRRRRGAADQRDQPVERIPTVVLLRTVALRSYDDDILARQSAAGQPRQPVAHIRR